MTSLEARVAQNAQSQPGPAKEPGAETPAAPAPAKVSQNPISDYQAEKAALLAQAPPAGAPTPPDDIEQQIIRDEFGDQVHDPDKDAELGHVASPAIPPAVDTNQPAQTPEEERLLPHRIPTKQFSRVEQEAMALKHTLETENPGQSFSLKECLDRVENLYGAKPAVVPTPTNEPALDPNLPQTLQDLETQRRTNAKAIRDKRTEIAKAEVELRYDDKLVLVQELNGLETTNETLEEYAPRLVQHEQAQASKIDAAYGQSAQRTIDLYPDAQVKGSAFYNRMAEIDALFKETNDPRFASENKPMIIAQMVAAEQNVAPRAQSVARATPTAPLPPVLAAPGTFAAHLAPPVASGLARTTTPTISNADAEIAAVRNPEQLENLKLKLLGRPKAA